MEDNQPQMSRKNLRKWLTSKFNIQFEYELGKFGGKNYVVVKVPDDERQPILALKIEKYTQTISDAAIFDMFLDEEDEPLKGSIEYEVSLKNITKYNKQEMAKYFKELFDRDSNFWKIYTMDRSI